MISAPFYRWDLGSQSPGDTWHGPGWNLPPNRAAPRGPPFTNGVPQEE
jgi:hypothetical protein